MFRRCGASWAGGGPECSLATIGVQDEKVSRALVVGRLLVKSDHPENEAAIMYTLHFEVVWTVIGRLNTHSYPAYAALRS